LYFSLCNNAANKIICGEYSDASSRLQECKRIIDENPEINFPSVYKIENNITIASFLQNEGKMFDYFSRKKEDILQAAKTAITMFEKLLICKEYESSHIIEFNLLSMYMLCDMNEPALKLLNKFKDEYQRFDVFYKYYYDNCCCAKNILLGKYNIALSHLKNMENANVLLLSKFSRILDSRNKIIRQLISEKYSGDSFCYNYEFVRRGLRVQDVSAAFWERGFLLSDLQFFSL
jgi:hypothetical protein